MQSHEAHSDNGCDVGHHGHVSVDVDTEIADRRNWLLAARQCCQCGPDQMESGVVDVKMSTRRPHSWCVCDSAAADWMPSKLKPHQHRWSLSHRARQNLRVGESGRFECRQHRHEESAGGASLTAAGQWCTEGIGLA